MALAYHGYEDTKITDIVEFAGISRATFYEHFDSKEACFAAAYDEGIERASAAIGNATGGETDWARRVSLGLRVGLEFLAADPPLAHLLLVESLAAARPARLEHERSLVELAEALRLPAAGSPSGEVLSEDTARLLAGGLASHISGRVSAGEAERLPELHGLLLDYLLTPFMTASVPAAGRQQAGHA